MKILAFLLLSASALAQSPPAPIEFVSVFNAYGKVEVQGYGPATKATVSGCGSESITDSMGRFTLSGRVKAGGYLGCTIQVSLPGCDPLNVPLPAPAGSINLGVLVLKPSISSESAGSVSFLSLAAPPDSRKLKQRAKKSMQDGKWADAQRALQSALKKYENDPESWFGLGITFRRENKPAQARDAFEKAASLDPRFVPPFVELALLSLQEKNWTAAIERSQHALKENATGFPEARVYLATAYLNTADFAAAEREARSAATGPRALPKAHHILGVALAKLDRIPEAIKEFEQFLALSPNAPEAATVRQHITLLQNQNR